MAKTKLTRNSIPANFTWPQSFCLIDTWHTVNAKPWFIKLGLLNKLLLKACVRTHILVFKGKFKCTFAQLNFIYQMGFLHVQNLEIWNPICTNLIIHIFSFQSDGTATIRTRKFMTNRLLCRKQMVIFYTLDHKNVNSLLSLQTFIKIGYEGLEFTSDKLHIPFKLLKIKTFETASESCI